MSNMWPLGHMQLRVVMNVVQHKIINLLKTLGDFFKPDCSVLENNFIDESIMSQCRKTGPVY